MKLFTSLLMSLALMSVPVAGQKQKPKPCEDAQTQADMNICWGNPQFPHRVMAGGGIYAFNDREVPDTFHLIADYGSEAYGASIIVNWRASVDLPQPDSPTTASVLPRSSENDTPFNAFTVLCWTCLVHDRQL